MCNPPNLYLTSTDVRPTLKPRKCTILQKLWSEERQDYFLRLRVEPSIKGGYFNIEQEDINEVVVATRHNASSLVPISELSIVVYVCHILNGAIRDTEKVSGSDLHVLLIGELYESLEEAEKAISFELSRI